ncbi:MAG TPA: hypothetical protein VJ225_03250, partial [Nitrososphaeraceae archaeon]|nr:hypothetical protein [Nitrososphaeraceae archaeon]
MSIQLKLKLGTLIVIGSIIAMGMIAAPALLRAMTVEAGNLTSTATAFVGGAIVNGQSDPQKITCSTGGSMHTNGLQ